MTAILQTIFSNAFPWKKRCELISLEISLAFVHKVRINDILSLVQVMTWRRPGDKLLSEPMMFSLLTHTCVTRPQWIKHGILDHSPLYKHIVWSNLYVVGVNYNSVTRVHSLNWTYDLPWDSVSCASTSTTDCIYRFGAGPNNQWAHVLGDSWHASLPSWPKTLNVGNTHMPECTANP